MIGRDVKNKNYDKINLIEKTWRKNNISIHTPLAGSDLSAIWMHTTCCNFNPHSPCGERPQK